MGRSRALALGMLLLAAPLSARAQEGGEGGGGAGPSAPVAIADTSEVSAAEEAALEFRANVPWVRLVLSGRQSIAGRSPLRVPGPILGDFWLKASGPGVETQRGRVRFSLDETGSRVYSYGTTPFRENLVRSVVPGLPQFLNGDRIKGTMLGGVGLTGIGLSIWAQNDYRDAEDRLGSLDDRLGAATNPDTIAVLQEARLDARAESEHFKDRRDLMIKATAVVWGVGLLDAVAFRPRFDVREADETSLTLSLRTRTRGRALLRSAVFPGLGQEYNGDGLRAFCVGTGGIAAGAYLVWRQEDLDRARAGLRAAEDRLAAVPGSANETRRDGRVRDVDDAKRERDRALWIAAGYWGLSLIDTALSFQAPWGDVPVEGSSPAGTIGWTIDPFRGGLAAQVRF